ncbi:MAG: DUF2087 domain-containing protein [Promicromonosporaceae bacterium]|nr:DUF2087 domain-containing protein [Promicromonosporaceae bacterium]
MAPVNPDVSRFLHDGRLVAMPRRWEHRRAVARWLAHQTLPDLLEPVGEAELTGRLAALAADPVGVRRLLVDLGVAHRTRDGAEYWRTELTEYDDVGDRRTVHLDGGAADSVPEFYGELGRVLSAGQHRLEPSVDALDDLLGTLDGPARVTVVWHDVEHSREALGFAATLAYLQGIAAQAPPGEQVSRWLADLEAGRGRTYLELVLGTFAAHPEIELVLR